MAKELSTSIILPKLIVFCTKVIRSFFAEKSDSLLIRRKTLRVAAHMQIVLYITIYSCTELIALPGAEQLYLKRMAILFCVKKFQEIERLCVDVNLTKGFSVFATSFPFLFSLYALLNVKRIWFSASPCEAFHTVSLFLVVLGSILYVISSMILYLNMGDNVIANWDHWCFCFSFLFARTVVRQSIVGAFAEWGTFDQYHKSLISQV